MEALVNLALYQSSVVHILYTSNESMKELSCGIVYKDILMHGDVAVR